MSGVGVLRMYAPEECGADGYPLAWHKGEPSVKDLVRETAGNRCVRCGHPYVKREHGKGEWSPCDDRCTHGGPLRRTGAGAERVYEAQWRILTVHHLTGVKADLRWWNLVALCQRDHLQIQGRVRMEQVYPYEHSDWFKPYAAGYYAATYLGEDLTREEAVERLDELLALELHGVSE